MGAYFVQWFARHKVAQAWADGWRIPRTKPIACRHVQHAVLLWRSYA